jgi:predicted DsbA family dithiol-disulfide isomerase
MAGLIGIRGVPFFLIDDRYALQGAQPPQVFEAALRLAACAPLADRNGAAPAHIT